MRRSIGHLLGVSAVLIVTASASGAERSQWNGIYSSAQAERGKVVYAEQCAACHGVDLRGGAVSNPLVGDLFEAKWNDFSVAELFERIRTTMPLNKPGSLSARQTADVLAFVLASGSYPSGNDELPATVAALDSVMFRAAKPASKSPAANVSSRGDLGQPNKGAAYNVPGQAELPDEREVRRGGGAKLPDGPWEYDTLEYRIKVTKIVEGLDLPWGIEFLPNGDFLISERSGQLRIVKNGTLDPKPITGLPQVLFRDFDGLMDIALHPDFRRNRLVYFTYTKPSVDRGGQVALGRGRYTAGYTLEDVEDLFIGRPATPRNQLQSALSRLIFGPDVMIYMTTGNPNQDRLKAQDPTSHRGKILRLKDDGSAPNDNPFIGKALYGVAYQPEIFSLGHRSPQGLAFHPSSGQLWELENGPQGGDEINIILPGKNYGWPITSVGREYDGRPFPPDAAGMEQPFIVWVPAIAPSGMAFYTGDKFPKWKGNLFVGALRGAHLQRITFNAMGFPIADASRNGREQLLYELAQRIRLVKQGPDGLIYVLTDYAGSGALLRIEPALSAKTPNSMTE